jgi:RNA polymerase sigma-54 factor
MKLIQSPTQAFEQLEEWTRIQPLRGWKEDEYEKDEFENEDYDDDDDAESDRMEADDYINIDEYLSSDDTLITKLNQ